MAIGTALGFSQPRARSRSRSRSRSCSATALTSLPLLRAGLALSAVIPIALASDTLSIATMEVVDNLIMLVIPGAMEARPRRPAVLGQPLVRARDRRSWSRCRSTGG